ncbi:MAG TPA: hypothetical protein DCY72_05850 [Ruminococcaceae bacterium]|nr:hypothetical protein [Oscillospiraceae bacterium]
MVSVHCGATGSTVTVAVAVVAVAEVIELLPDVFLALADKVTVYTPGFVAVNTPDVSSTEAPEGLTE